jgi:hypothetical protein
LQEYEAVNEDSDANNAHDVAEAEAKILDPIPDSLRPMVIEIATHLEMKHDEIEQVLRARDGAFKLASSLPKWISPAEVASPTRKQTAWELIGRFYMFQNRCHEAIAVFESLFQQMIRYQEESKRRVDKGMPLVWMSDCFALLGCRTHAKRYLMMTLCEESIRHKGKLSLQEGVYFRLVWHYGLPPEVCERYARKCWEDYSAHDGDSDYPERLLLELDDEWQSEIPSVQESGMFRCSGAFVKRLLGRLGTDGGRSLELLAHYLVSLIPGCRAYRRRRSRSTDFDVVGLFEGPAIDFRAELGRMFVCECKDWNRPADFTAFAKFCRVLDSIKSRFGIIFSRDGITGSRSDNDAERERFKVFADRGIAIVLITKDELDRIAEGANLVSMLRLKYEQIRLDLRPGRDTEE